MQPAQPVPVGFAASALQAAARAASPVASSEVAANGAAILVGHGHVTPAVRMLLREHGVDVGQVTGSGIGGRVTKKDVLEYVQRRDAAARAAGPAPAPAAAHAATYPASPPAAPATPTPATPASAPPVAAAGSELPAFSAAGEEGDQLLPMTSIRRAIADHMVRSRQTSPHAWLMVEVDMSRVVHLRERSKAAFKERYGISLTYLPFVARAVVEALQRRPTFNAQWSDAGLVLKHDIHLGIAVALEENLVVPVLRNADRLSISGLAQAMTDLGNRARANRLKLDEIQGGTFTLNNTGALGAVMTQAIINQPQAAILTMDAVVKRPVVIDDMIAIRPIMNLGMSFDHRINDGLQAARFLQDVKGQLEGLDESATLL
jgi:2-oxoisovalerate dehydrogenase E2 component (dihydrolipoyl transacylase)